MVGDCLISGAFHHFGSLPDIFLGCPKSCSAFLSAPTSNGWESLVGWPVGLVDQQAAWLPLMQVDDVLSPKNG